MKYRAVFFDLDGTLLDTSPGVIGAIDYISEVFRLRPLTMEEKRSFIGPPIQKSFQTHYDLSEERAWELAQVWREAYKDVFLMEAEPYEGIYDLLRSLQERGIRTGVATNKREDYTVKLLEHFGFLPLFNCVVGSEFDGKRTKSDMIRLCMKKTGIQEPARCLMVGDTEGDRKAAQESGTDFLGVSYGFGYQKNTSVPGLNIVENCCGIASYIEDALGRENYV